MPELLRILELVLEVVKLAMEGQPPDVRAELWRLYLEDVKDFRVWWSVVTARS